LARESKLASEPSSTARAPSPRGGGFTITELASDRVSAGLFDYDAELRLHNEHFRAAAGVGPDDRVLDIGCGTGQSTRQAARAAVRGSALGVDVSEQMLADARRRSDEQGVRNVSYLLADAQVHRFPPAGFDLCLSRFGTMFFTDPVAAFANIGRALRPAARLVLLVWQHQDRNEWSYAIRRALGATAASPPPAAPFSLADPATATDILAAAGFVDVRLADVHEPVYYGPDRASAYDMVLCLAEPKRLLAELEGAAADRARDRLRALIADHDTGQGVYFDSRAWIITAQRH
jgi:SAM-dependent methyltransferase